MEKKIQHTERRGLPGGPNEMFTYTTGVFSTEGFRMDSPDVNNYQNIIPSGSITMKERDGSPLRKGPIHGIDNLGNEQVMYPGFNYQFPGTEVTETLMAKMGGALLDKTIKCGNCGWEWKAADGGSDLYNCHKCKGGKGVVKAQVGTETKPRPSYQEFLTSIKRDKEIDYTERPRKIISESTKIVAPKLQKKLTKQQAKIIQEDFYKNPVKQEGITSGDKAVDFLYNNEWLMDVPIVGGYIKNKAKQIAKDSGGRQVVDDIEEKAGATGFTDELGHYTGNTNFIRNKSTLLDQYFSKDALLPKSKYKPKDDYLEFLPSYSIKGDFDKDITRIEQLNYEIDRGTGDSKYKEFLKNKKPIYDDGEYSGMAGILRADLGSYKTGIAWDDKMNLPYMSVSDAWDFEPSVYSKKWTGSDEGKEKTDKAFIQSYLLHKAGNPFKVYDRFYFDPKTKQYIPDEQLGNYTEGGEPPIAQIGIETKPLGAGKYNTTTGNIVDWGTPEYEAAYNRGEVLSDKGVPSEVTMQGGKLDEVVVKNNYKRGFLEKYKDKIVEENKDAGPLGAIIGTPISAITSLPQLAATYGITGKVERPSEAMDIQNPYGAMAVDAVLDPANIIGASELTALGRLSKEQALAKLKNISSKLTQGLQANDLKFNNKDRIVYTLDDLQITPQDEIQDLHDNLLSRFNTEEGKRRLGLLGIDNTKLNPAELSFKNTGSGYFPTDNTMDIDLQEAIDLGIDPSTIYAHETGHWLTKQYGDQSPTLMRKKFYETPIDEEFSRSYPENFANELLAKNPNVDFSKISKETSAAYMLNQQDEAFPFLREMRQNMLNKGYINDEYDNISQETIDRFIKENPDDRISSFTEPNSKQSKAIYQQFKNLPAIIPGAIGLGALQQQAEGGEPSTQSSLIEYVVQKGDTLSKIAAANNTSVRSIMKNNEGIADPNIISINQKINLATQSSDAIVEEVYKDWNTIRDKKDKINKLSNEQKIVSFHNDKPEESYLIVDKKNAVMKLYTGGNLTKSFEVGVGQNVSDAQTVTKVKDGKTDWSAGNKSTGAGVYTISNINPASEEYYNEPAFNLKNENGIEVSTTIHGTPKSRRVKFNNGTVIDNRMSNGCINGKCEDLKELYGQLDVNTKVYILPEDKGNNFQIIDGKPALRVSAQNRQKYNSYVDQTGTTQKGQGANQTTNTLVYKPIKATLDKSKFKDNVFQWNDFNDEKEYTNTTKPFIAALTTGKKDVMKAAKISSDIYNELAKMSFGIYGTESNFGDTHSAIGNFARATNKLLDSKSSSSPDYKSKASTYGADENYRSVGLTQLRWNYLNADEKKALKEVGITSNKDFLDPKKAAVGTVTVLGVRYNQQLNDKQKQDVWKYLPTKWNNRANYSDRVKSNSSYLSFKQLDKKEIGGESKLGPLMQAYNTMVMQKKMGGAITNKKQFGGQLNSSNVTMYKDYIKGNIGNEVQAIKNYDKLNRIYYSKAKDLGMSTPNYIMTHVIGNS